MPFLKLRRKTSDKSVEQQASGIPSEGKPAASSDKKISPRLSPEHDVAAGQSRPPQLDMPKTVRIDESSFSTTVLPAYSSSYSTKSAAKQGPKKSAIASPKSPTRPGTNDENESVHALASSSYMDTSSDGYQSSRESFQSPSTPATSIASSAYVPVQPREIAHGFEKRVAQLPPPPPRLDSGVKLSLGHGKDGSRPAFRVASPPGGRSSKSPKAPRSPRSPEKEGK